MKYITREANANVLEAFLDHVFYGILHSMKKKYFFFLTPVILTLLVIAFIVAAQESAKNKRSQRNQSANEKLDDNKLLQRYETLIYNSMSPSFGPRNARVSVVEFLDFQCPYCQASHEGLMRLMKKYQSSSVRFEFRQFPLTAIHEYALPAAHAALCAHEQNKYLAMQDIFFTRQEQINQESFSRWAAELGLNLAQYNACVADKKYTSLIKKDLSDAQSLGIQGTPTWFINGERVVGAISYEELSAIVEDYLGRAPSASTSQ